MNNLTELVTAVRDGAATNVVAFMDNDNVSFYDNGGSGEHLLSLHPFDVQTEALALLGLNVEQV
jgi:hypothetical protein